MEHRPKVRPRSVVTALAAAGALGACGPATPTAEHPGPLDETFAVSDFFTPSGYMGDGEFLGKLRADVNSDACKPRPPGARGTCYRFSYLRGDVGWAGVYWVFPANNWGSLAGRAVDGPAFDKGHVSVWAASEAEGLMINFNVGNISDPTLPYRDRLSGSTSDKLSRDWKQFNIDISGQGSAYDQVIGAFAWSVAYPDALDPTGTAPVVIYLDDIVWDTAPAPAAPAVMP
jgi:hypothetical protein